MPFVEADDGAQAFLGAAAAETQDDTNILEDGCRSPNAAPSEHARLLGVPETSHEASGRQSTTSPAPLPTEAAVPPERFNLFAVEERMSQAKHPEVEVCTLGGAP